MVGGLFVLTATAGFEGQCLRIFGGMLSTATGSEEEEGGLASEGEGDTNAPPALNPLSVPINGPKSAGWENASLSKQSLSTYADIALSAQSLAVAPQAHVEKVELMP